MGYQGFFEILMITVISSKKLGGYKIMSNTVGRHTQREVIWYKHATEGTITYNMDFLRIYFLRNETLLSWKFPVIKIRLSLSNILIRGESNPLQYFD